MQIDEKRRDCENLDVFEESLLNSYSTRFRSMAYRFTKDYDRAEDLAQDIFLKIFQCLPSYDREIGCFENWVFRLGRNLIIDYFRVSRKYRQTSGSEDLEQIVPSRDTSADPFQRLFRSEQCELILRAIDKLPQKLKEAISLRHLKDLSYDEIAETLGVPDGTVKSRISRAREALCSALANSLKGQNPS